MEEILATDSQLTLNAEGQWNCWVLGGIPVKCSDILESCLQPLAWSKSLD